MASNKGYKVTLVKSVFGQLKAHRATVRGLGEPYTFGFAPAELPSYLVARGLRLVEDVGASDYRERYLTPLGRGQEPLTEFQRAALVEGVGRD